MRPINKVIRLSCSFAFISLLTTCQIDSSNQSDKAEISTEASSSSNWQKEEEEVKQAVEEFLFHVGNYNHQAVANSMMDYANVGYFVFRDAWQGKSMTFNDYFNDNSDTSKQIPYYEPPHNYTIVISEGTLAFVRAECILHRFGVKQSVEDDFLTLMKIEGQWKILSGSFTAKKLPEEERVFDLEAFAKSYAQAWGSNRPEFVAMYYAENGSLKVNDGDAATSRKQIADVAQGFMTDLPDMRVSFDSLINKPGRLEFFWTLTATHATSSKKIKVSGSEEWTLENNLISVSQGHFPSEEYNRQIKEGFQEINTKK